MMSERVDVNVEDTDIPFEPPKTAAQEAAAEAAKAEPAQPAMSLSELQQAHEKLRMSHEKISNELAAEKEKVLRGHAELENARRLARVELEKAHKFGNERFAKELLQTIDNLERALETQGEGTDDAVIEGVSLTLKGLLDTFARFGIEVIETEGITFNPELHEALSMQPTAEAEPNTILSTIQKGYTINGRLLRPARVIVAAAMPNA